MRDDGGGERGNRQIQTWTRKPVLPVVGICPSLSRTAWCRQSVQAVPGRPHFRRHVETLQPDDTLPLPVPFFEFPVFHLPWLPSYAGCPVQPFLVPGVCLPRVLCLAPLSLPALTMGCPVPRAP